MEGKMKNVIDLSGPMQNGLWGYHELPGLEGIVPHVEVETIATVKEDGFFSSRVVLSTISASYVEAGSHIIENAKNLDEYPPERFIRPAKIVRLPVQKPKARIGSALLKEHTPEIESGDALIIDTGWGRMWNKPGYVLQCPNLLGEALEWVLEKDISIFAVDIPCIEASWSENDEETKGGLLAEIFGREILLTAPLVNLERVKNHTGTLICPPLSIKGTSGAPARIVFVEDEKIV
jgi:kynurenine formamidase